LSLAQYLHVLLREPDFLVKLPEHGFLERFTAADSTLGELPPAAAGTAPKKNVTRAVHQDDADVCAKSL